ncbi:iron complex transport system permease protein [Pelomonas aquatica]|uniref:Iron complex transport system permease protein n=1 Tax=Pelomonas aquatica TaxID=431058 RepID=A0ABU1ZD02_9BURK|nr:iron ABC transporter permease [Pelomonas aquatica]MDR7297561.1 iron complex transport system permease protein [Pelomonas aquatica]
MDAPLERMGLRWPALPGWPLAFALLAAAVFVAANSGALSLGLADWQALIRGEPTQGAMVLAQLRMPRVAFAVVVGAALGLAGALSQGVFRNPLAEPSLLGIPGGAVCAVALMLTVFAAWAGGLPAAWRPFAVPLAALVGAWVMCGLLQGLARLLVPGAVAGLLLAGLALNALAMALVGLCTYLATDEQLRNLTFWQLGSLAMASWPIVAVLGVAVAAVLALSRRWGQALNALALGEAVAAQVGVPVARLRRVLVLALALLSGLAVAWCGLIGFIGLLAPHAARGIVGADARRVLPLAAWFGALLMLLADTAARTLAVPAELPVGILTALLGAPVLFALLKRAQREIGGGW